MSDLWDWGKDHGNEPERYELGEGPAYSFALDRRLFLESIGGGLAVLLTIRGLSSVSAQAADTGARAADPIASWLHIDERGKITAFTGKAEVGQGIRTSLAQVVAEELRCSVESVSLVMGDTDLTPFDRGTFGSRTMPSMAPQLRRVAAAARELLVERAATRWGVDASAIEVRDGAAIRAETGERLGFGTLTAGEKLLHEIDEDTATIPPETMIFASVNSTVPAAACAMSLMTARRSI